MSDTDARIDELFATPPEEFTKARNALAKELAGEGDKENSDSVKALKRPSLPVWAINQVARRHRDEMEELVGVMRGLSDLDAASLRASAEKRRDLVASLADRARDILEEHGHSATSTTTHRIAQSLLAASAEEDLEALATGRLTHELESSGFGALSGFEAAAAGGPYRKEDDRAARRRAEELDRAAGEAEREANRLATEAERADRAARSAHAAAEKAARRAEKARAAAERAQGDLT